MRQKLGRVRVRLSGQTVVSGRVTSYTFVFHDKLGCSTDSYLPLTGDSLRICPSVEPDATSPTTGFSKIKAFIERVGRLHILRIYMT